MDTNSREKLKVLANEGLIEFFGQDSLSQRIAKGLEKAVEELEEANERCPQCSICETHGNKENDEIEVDASEVLTVYKQLKDRLKEFKEIHVALSTTFADIETDDLLETLAEQIEQLESDIDELERTVIP